MEGQTMRQGVFVLLATAILLIPSACGGDSTPQQTAETDDTVDNIPVAAEAAPCETIVLPDGWVMNDAVSSADVEEIMGRTGYMPFAEAASSAGTGRPVGSFNIGDVPWSKVRFEVDVNGGVAAYETAIGYITDPVQINGDLWNFASFGEVVQGDRTQMRMIGYKGDVFFSISWDSQVYSDLDGADTGKKLAEMLINNLFTR
jgi:hypothetical protein